MNLLICPNSTNGKYPEPKISHTELAVILSERGPERLSVRGW